MDEIWSRVNAIDAISCVMWDESGSRRWRAEQLVKVVQWSYAHHWNRLLTAESVGLSNKDSGVTLNKLSFRCGALFNALSIRNPDFLIFAFRFLILIPA